MKFPILITINEMEKTFRMGRTTIYERIKMGELTVGKYGCRTLITFRSAIELALRGLKEGNGIGDLTELFMFQNGMSVPEQTLDATALLSNIPSRGDQAFQHLQESMGSSAVFAPADLRQGDV